ncbi:MAG: alpha/beta hydrolase [Alphaproteobacteria bacterium]|nr:alpha/beta hydrolase [Alphaproteobacteria bacterium]
MAISHVMMDIVRERIFVSDSGSDRPALLFVHGAMMDHTVWYKQVAHFQQTNRCVCPDLRGHGKSSAASAQISFEDHCDDLAEIIDRLNLHDITLIGWSMAGCLCQVFVTRYAGKVARLVLVDTIPQRLSDDRFPYGQDPASTPKTKKALEDDYAATCDGFGRRISPEDDDIALFIADIARRARQDVAINDYVSTDARSQIDLLPSITLPTAIISGENDQVCNPAASTFMAERIPGCRDGVLTIDQAGHAPFLTRPDKFNSLLQSFLETETLGRGGVEI